MKKLMAGLAFSVLALSGGALSYGDGGNIEWSFKEKNLNEALKVAKEKGLPVMVYFTANW